MSELGLGPIPCSLSVRPVLLLGRAGTHGGMPGEARRGGAGGQGLILLCRPARPRLAFPPATLWGRGRAGVPWHPARMGYGSTPWGRSLGDE